MIQDIYPHRLHNEFIADKKAGANDRVFVFDGNNCLVHIDDGQLILPTAAELGAGEYTFLFALDDADYYRAAPPVVKAPEGFEFMKIYDIRHQKTGPREMMFALYTAFHIDKWYKDSVHCGRCGSKTVNSVRERARVCPVCGNTVYPRINPAVIVGIRNGDRILVTKYANRAHVPYYALVAGFTEIGETLEQTVVREVFEEVGLKVKNITYYKSQPWGTASDLLTGFFCDVDGDDTIRMDQGELKIAEWKTAAEIELQPDDYSLTNEMMQLFRDGHI
ncbi:NAD+ diphosphatase [Ruminococcaceae bacterium YRB3002]|nr:NAD+ diphosphatase [Ruminococcaceae bacterium YRB3002]